MGRRGIRKREEKRSEKERGRRGMRRRGEKRREKERGEEE